MFKSLPLLFGSLLSLSVLSLSGCEGSASAPRPTTPATNARGESPVEPAPVTGESPRWKTLYREDFSKTALPAAEWSEDTYPDDGVHSDNGEFFQARGVVPPKAFRASAAFGQDGWLTFESYSRSSGTPLSTLISVGQDLAGTGGSALKIHSPLHTDATVIRPTRPLPDEYRVCVEVGYADFGDGAPGNDHLNGYLGGETSGPWTAYDATRENGFYWLTILDSIPRPHNNVWIHHHRKVVIDSDNNREGWTQIWDGTTFRQSGEHPVMMFALARDGRYDDLIGKPFISYSGGEWQPTGEVRAADAYLDQTWYTACIERTAKEFKLTTTGKFKYGGETRYEAAIDADRVYQAGVKPDYFMFGDPHNNFYRGTVYYRNVSLEVPNNGSVLEAL